MISFIKNGIELPIGHHLAVSDSAYKKVQKDAFKNKISFLPFNNVDYYFQESMTINWNNTATSADVVFAIQTDCGNNICAIFLRLFLSQIKEQLVRVFDFPEVGSISSISNYSREKLLWVINEKSVIATFEDTTDGYCTLKIVDYNVFDVDALKPNVTFY